MRTSRWPTAQSDADFSPYLEGAESGSVGLFGEFVARARACGPVTFELQRHLVVLCGTRRIFASVAPVDEGLRGHLVLARRMADDARLRRVEPLTKKLWYHGYRLSDPKELNETFAAWLCAARQVGDGTAPT